MYRTPRSPQKCNFLHGKHSPSLECTDSGHRICTIWSQRCGNAHFRKPHILLNMPHQYMTTHHLYMCCETQNDIIQIQWTHVTNKRVFNSLYFYWAGYLNCNCLNSIHLHSQFWGKTALAFCKISTFLYHKSKTIWVWNNYSFKICEPRRQGSYHILQFVSTLCPVSYTLPLNSQVQFSWVTQPPLWSSKSPTGQ